MAERNRSSSELVHKEPSAIDFAVIYPKILFFYRKKIVTNRISSVFYHRMSRLGGNRISEGRLTHTKKRKKSVNEKTNVTRG